MRHAIEFFYAHAGHVLRPYMETVPGEPGDICHICQRPIDQWAEPDEKVLFSNYGNLENHCLPCHSLFEGSEELFGVERRSASGTAIPMKLGMATGCGALITPEKTTLYLNGFIDKMKQAPKPPFEMVKLSGQSAHKSVVQNPPAREFLYIGNFGRKKADLVANMALSGYDTLVICEESGQITLPLSASQAIINAAETVKPSFLKQIKSTLRQLYTGALEPADDRLTETLVRLRDQEPKLWEALQSLPADPHQRLNILKLIG